MTEENRISDSPTSTIDSTESASISIETIIDRNPSACDSKMIEKQTAALANSTNTTNTNYNKNSLTNSQISMISSTDQKDTSPIFNNPELLLSTNEKKKPPTPFPLTEKNCLTPVEVQQHQIPLKDENVSITKRFKNEFPKQILFGIVQFVLSVALIALGALLIVRNASLAGTGCGIWAGGIAAIAGALSVINLKSAQTGFLAVSLICVASGTLALAMAGSGLVRDMNRLEQEETNRESIKGAISAASGLIFALSVHLVVSIASVYHSAIKICSRENQTQMLSNVITVNNASITNHEKIEEIIKSMTQSSHGRGKMAIPENADKLMAMWMCTAKHGANHHSTKNGPQLPPRPIMLVPAGNGHPPPVGYRHPSGNVRLGPGMIAAPMSLPYPTVTVPMPVLQNGAALHPDDIKAFYRMRAAVQKTASEMGRHYQQHPPQRRTGKSEASRRQRRRSESDVVENRRAFTYTGLDRTIADDFLKQQEQSNSSHAGYSSEDSIRDDGGHDSTL